MTYNEFCQSDFYKKSVFEKNITQDLFESKNWDFISTNFDSWQKNIGTNKNGIPHIIHQIWLGSELPEKYFDFCNSWKEKNPDWKYILWDEKSILQLENFAAKKAFVVSKSFGLKSDIARYEILRQFGGIYADTDFECIQSFDYIADNCSFFLGNMFDIKPNICNAIIGCTPNHFLINEICKNVIEPLKTTEIMEIINGTGPGLVTKLYLQNITKLNHFDVIFPSTYFYAFPNFKLNEKNNGKIKEKYCTENTYAIHYWDVSWSKVDFFNWLIRKYKRGIKKLKRLFCL